MKLFVFAVLNFGVFFLDIFFSDTPDLSTHLSMSLLEQQVPLARRRGVDHVILSDTGHMDAILGTAGANAVVRATLEFLR
jgi:hypothetical protein